MKTPDQQFARVRKDTHRETTPSKKIQIYAKNINTKIVKAVYKN